LHVPTTDKFLVSELLLLDDDGTVL
jgi:hypothetical protein